MRALAAAVLALCLAACGSGGGSSPASTTTTSAAALKTFSVPSANTGLTYDVTVYTPAGYTESTIAKPVIYAMDHELQFPLVRQTVELLGLDAIIVSIGNLGSARRFIDFDLPGGVAYYRFITLELIPFIEAQYRIDRTRRTLVGYSLSGLEGVISLFEENPSSRNFSGYVFTDPSLQFHTVELYAYEQHLWDTTHSLPVTVHHCSTSASYPFADFPDTIVARGYTGLHYQFRLYQFDHATVLGPCLNDGLRYVFGLG